MTHKVPTFGSRIQVYRGHAKKTTGGLTKSDLMMNKHGRVVSKAKHFTAKKEKRLLKHGYGTQKGKFGYVKINSKSRKSRSKKMRGGMIPLSPSELGADGISGAGITNFGSSSDSVQFRAGMSGGRRRSKKMRGGSGMSPLSLQGSADWSGDGISGAGITDFGSSSDSVQFRAGMSGGKHRNHSLALGRAKARGMGRSKALALAKSGGQIPLGGMRGGTGNRSLGGVGSAALQLEAGNAS